MRNGEKYWNVIYVTYVYWYFGVKLRKGCRHGFARALCCTTEIDFVDFEKFISDLEVEKSGLVFQIKYLHWALI